VTPEEVLKTHAKSFRFAAPLLPKEQRAEAAVAYAFCRLVDDVVDEAPTAEIADRDLAELERELDGRAPARPIVAAYLDVAKRRGIPDHAALDLARGVRSDLGTVRVADDAELLLYCYRVAGTVGLMMCGIMGVRDPRATAFAVDLGIGMQLTNICRDVREDEGRHRVYLPRARLDAAGPFDVVTDLLALAERYYDSGHAGLRYVPFRPRLAIYVAGAVYRAIGRKLLRRGPEALEGRTYTTFLEKIVVAALALGRGLVSGLLPKPAHDPTLHAQLDQLVRST
jgi:phytoene synthase